jgi:hypothetical protein
LIDRLKCSTHLIASSLDAVKKREGCPAQMFYTPDCLVFGCRQKEGRLSGQQRNVVDAVAMPCKRLQIMKCLQLWSLRANSCANSSMSLHASQYLKLKKQMSINFPD